MTAALQWLRSRADVFARGPGAAGALIQGANFLSLAAQGFVVPRLLGARDYGVALQILTPVWLVHGVLETLLVTLTIDWAHAPADRSRTQLLWRDAALFTALAGLVVGSYGFAVLTRESSQSFGSIALAVLLLGALVANAVGLAIAYSVGAIRIIWLSYLLTAVMVPAGVFALRPLGALGFVAALVVNQVLIVACLLGIPEIRAFVIEVGRSNTSGTSRGRWGTYLAVLSPRAVQILLTSGVMLIGTWTLPAVDLATLKVSLSLIGAGANASPISAPLLLAALKRDALHASRRARGARALILSAAFGIVASAALVRWGGQVRAYFLRGEAPVQTPFDVMFIGLPCFVLIGPLSAYLVATGRTRALRWSAAAAFAGVLVPSAFGKLALGFDVGAALFVGSCLLALLHRSEKTSARSLRRR